MILLFNQTCETFMPSESSFFSPFAFSLLTDYLLIHSFIHSSIRLFVCLFFYGKYHVFFLYLIVNYFAMCRFSKSTQLQCFIISRRIKDGLHDLTSFSTVFITVISGRWTSDDKMLSVMESRLHLTISSF